MGQRSIAHVSWSSELITQPTCVPDPNCSCRDTEKLLNSDSITPGEMGEVLINSVDNLSRLECRVVVVGLVKSEGSVGTMDTESGRHDREDGSSSFSGAEIGWRRHRSIGSIGIGELLRDQGNWVFSSKCAFSAKIRHFTIVEIARPRRKKERRQ
jgi:hypothetical protein